jgi:hypothetical protein
MHIWLMNMQSCEADSSSIIIRAVYLLLISAIAIMCISKAKQLCSLGLFADLISALH